MENPAGEKSSVQLIEELAQSMGGVFRFGREGGHDIPGPIRHHRKHVQFDLIRDGQTYHYVSKDNYATGYGGSTTTCGVYACLEGIEHLEVHISPKDIFDSITDFFKRDDVKLGNRDFDKGFYVKGTNESAIRGTFNNTSVLKAIEQACGISAPIYFEIRDDPEFFPFEPPLAAEKRLVGFETRLTWITDQESVAILFNSLAAVLEKLAE